jgi:hypothetical protein
MDMHFSQRRLNIISILVISDPDPDLTGSSEEVKRLIECN